MVNNNHIINDTLINVFVEKLPTFYFWKVLASMSLACLTFGSIYRYRYRILNRVTDFYLENRSQSSHELEHYQREPSDKLDKYQVISIKKRTFVGDGNGEGANAEAENYLNDESFLFDVVYSFNKQTYRWSGLETSQYFPTMCRYDLDCQIKYVEIILYNADREQIPLSSELQTSLLERLNEYAGPLKDFQKMQLEWMELPGIKTVPGTIIELSTDLCEIVTLTHGEQIVINLEY